MQAAKISAFTFDQSAFEVWSVKGKPQLRPQAFESTRSRRFASARQDRLRSAQTGLTIRRQSSQKETRLDTLALPEPDEAAASVLGKRYFSTRSVPNRRPDLTIVGKPLSETLKTCLVNSDNNMAENLMLMAAAKQGDISETPYKLGRERTESFWPIRSASTRTDFRFYDGSGMSRHNFVTARAIAKLLEWANRQPTAPLWKSCLVSPSNGTLKKRLEGVDFKGQDGHPRHGGGPFRLRQDKGRDGGDH